MARKPIRVFYSTLSGRFYASAHYREEEDHVVITGKKYDVTNDIGAAVVKHELEFSRDADQAALADEDEPDEIEGWAYEGWDGMSTIEITVGHCHTGMVPVYVRIRPREVEEPTP